MAWEYKRLFLLEILKYSKLNFNLIVLSELANWYEAFGRNDSMKLLKVRLSQDDDGLCNSYIFAHYHFRDLNKTHAFCVCRVELLDPTI